MRVYYWERVPLTVRIERIVRWRDAEASGEPDVFGAPRPGPPASQPPPAKGTGPRVDPERAARDARRLPHALVGWRGADGLPEVVPVEAAGASERGVELRAAPGALPAGARRAGLTAHEFRPRMVGQEQRVHTGWLDVDPDGPALYAPHTRAGYRMPASDALFVLAAGAVPRARLRGARRAGIAR
jgi:hypothetical protein